MKLGEIVNNIWSISRVKDTDKYYKQKMEKRGSSSLCVDDDQRDIFYQLFSHLCAACWDNWHPGPPWLFVWRQSGAGERYLEYIGSVYLIIPPGLDRNNQVEICGLICLLSRWIIKYMVSVVVYMKVSGQWNLVWTCLWGYLPHKHGIFWLN